jgi:EAL domain-containing protein (putative c-di-GMP-specific phosphodiesterase class I)/GGDEF domain-containing protein
MKKLIQSQYALRYTIIFFVLFQLVFIGMTGLERVQSYNEMIDQELDTAYIVFSHALHELSDDAELFAVQYNLSESLDLDAYLHQEEFGKVHFESPDNLAILDGDTWVMTDTSKFMPPDISDCSNIGLCSIDELDNDSINGLQFTYWTDNGRFVAMAFDLSNSLDTYSTNHGSLSLEYDTVSIFGTKQESLLYEGTIMIDGYTFNVGLNVDALYLLSFHLPFIRVVLLSLLFSLLSFYIISMINKNYGSLLEFKKNKDLAIFRVLKSLKELFTDFQEMDDNVDFYLGYIKLRNVKALTNSLGNKATIEHIVSLFKSVKESMTEYTDIYFYGGDDFIIITKETEDRDALSSMKRKVLKMQDKFEVDRQRFSLLISAGFIESKVYGRNLETLIQQAEFASSLAFDYDSSGMLMYDDVLKVQNQSVYLEQYANDFEETQVVPYFMPIMDVKTNKPKGFELLSRFYNKDKEELPTQEVINALEHIGKIETIDYMNVKRAFDYIKRFKEDSKEDVFISVNVSTKTLDDRFIDYLTNITIDDPDLRHLMSIEILESILLADMNYYSSLFTRLQNLGFKVSVDDFGSGYSSLYYILKLPVSVIKIDKSFLLNDFKSNLSVKMFEIMTDIVDKIDSEIVVEGVETQEAYDLINRFDFDYYQGYFAAKPMPYDKALKYYKKAS